MNKKILVLIIIFVIVLIGIFYVILTPKQTADEGSSIDWYEGRPPYAEIVSHNWNKDDENILVSGNVKHNTPEITYLTIDIYVFFYDEDNNYLDYDTTRVYLDSGIGVGDITDFQLSYSSSNPNFDKISYYKIETYAINVGQPEPTP